MQYAKMCWEGMIWFVSRQLEPPQRFRDWNLKKIFAFSVNVWQNYEFPSKNAGNWGILCWDQWSQRNMPICVEKDWYNLHMERKSPDGPPLSMQNIDGKLFWISSLASLMDPSFWSRERVCYQIFGPVWSCLHEWPEFEMILDRMSLTSPGPKL